METKDGQLAVNAIFPLLLFERIPSTPSKHFESAVERIHFITSDPG
jgi:hypothetical protein